MQGILNISAKEFKDSLRNRWILLVTILLTVLSMILTFFGSTAVGDVQASNLAVTVVSLSTLSIYLIPLIAIMLSYDAIIGEIERGTLLLILTYPVSRQAILLGKLVGHLCVLTFVITVGFGLAALLSFIRYGIPPIEDLLAFAQLVFTSILLGGVFVALSYLISVYVRERATAAGAGLFIWLFFVLIFDFGLIVLIANTGDLISEGTLNTIMMLNPTDIYRIINLTGFENVNMYSGLAEVSKYLPLDSKTMMAILIAWLVVPFMIAYLFFTKKEL